MDSATLNMPLLNKRSGYDDGIYRLMLKHYFLGLGYTATMMILYGNAVMLPIGLITLLRGALSKALSARTDACSWKGCQKCWRGVAAAGLAYAAGTAPPVLAATLAHAFGLRMELRTPVVAAVAIVALLPFGVFAAIVGLLTMAMSYGVREFLMMPLA